MAGSYEVQHNCEEMVSGFSPQAACIGATEVSWGGIVIGVLLLAGLVLVGILLWRRVKNRDL